MSQTISWKTAGLGALLLAAVVAPAALFVARAEPEPANLPAPVRAAAPAAKPFAAICKASAVVDPRPQPAWVGASFAQDNCRAPALPAQLDGHAASREQIVAAMTAAKRYAALSDAYQTCISDFVTARRLRAEHARQPVDAPLAIIENHRILVSQENKKVAAARIAVAITAFNEYGSDCPDH